jgi:hypothetical protein
MGRWSSQGFEQGGKLLEQPRRRSCSSGDILLDLLGRRSAWKRTPGSNTSEGLSRPRLRYRSEPRSQIPLVRFGRRHGEVGRPASRRQRVAGEGLRSAGLGTLLGGAASAQAAHVEQFGPDQRRREQLIAVVPPPGRGNERGTGLEIGQATPRHQAPQDGHLPRQA